MNKGIYVILLLIVLFGLASCSDKVIVENNSTVNNEAEDIFSYEQGKVKVYFFYGVTCPHCKSQIAFFESIESKYPEMEIHMFEVYNNQSNVRLFQEFSSRYNANPRGVPATFIGDKMWVGYASSVGIEIDEHIEFCKTNECRIPEI